MTDRLSSSPDSGEFPQLDPEQLEFWTQINGSLKDIGYVRQGGTIEHVQPNFRPRDENADYLMYSWAYRSRSGVGAILQQRHCRTPYQRFIFKDRQPMTVEPFTEEMPHIADLTLESKKGRSYVDTPGRQMPYYKGDIDVWTLDGVRNVFDHAVSVEKAFEYARKRSQHELDLRHELTSGIGMFNPLARRSRIRRNLVNTKEALPNALSRRHWRSPLELERDIAAKAHAEGKVLPERHAHVATIRAELLGLTVVGKVEEIAYKDIPDRDRQYVQDLVRREHLIMKRHWENGDKCRLYRLSNLGLSIVEDSGLALEPEQQD